MRTAARLTPEDSTPRLWVARPVRVEPLRPLASLPEAAQRGCAYYASRDGWSFEGIGEAVVITASGASRFQALGSAARAVFANLHTPDDSHGVPLRLVGGLAFAADGGTSAPWTAFGPARFVLPEVGLLRTAGEATLFAVAPAGVSEDAAETIAHRRLREIETALAHPAPRTVSDPRRAPTAQARATTHRHTDFEARVGRVVEQIRAGRGVHKVTLGTSEAWALGRDDLNAADVLQALFERFGDAFRFWIQPQSAAAFVGASPERLASVSGQSLRTEALAGTVACSGDDARDEALATWLRGSPKNRHEHEVVVRFIRDRLANISLRLDFPDEPEILKLANVQHLCTPMHARLDPDIAPRGVLGIAERLHPTPAVAGVPTELALEILADTEPDRGWYAGAVGVVDPVGDGELCVGIRAALIDRSETHLFAGAGIVAGSDPAQERVETEHKLRAMRGILCS